MAKNKDGIKKGRIIALLTREEMEFLDKLSMDAVFSTGHKLTRIDIISALIDAAMELKLTGEGVKDREGLADRILELLGARTERRLYPRLKSSLIAGFRKIDSLGDYKSGFTGDIGTGGFKVEMECPEPAFSVGQALEITIKDPRDKENPVVALGKISWMKQKERGVGCEIGVMLTYIRNEDKDRYMKYLYAENNFKIEED